MPTEADFLRTIAAHPNDHGPRLVFADWLEECGDPWAEFLRVQHQIAERFAPNDSGLDYATMPIPVPRRPLKEDYAIVRARTLLERHCAEWTRRLFPGWPGLRGYGWRGVGGDIVWWREIESSIIFEPFSRLFWWCGVPERIVADAAGLAVNLNALMDVLPLWNVELTGCRDAAGRCHVTRNPPYNALANLRFYAGRIRSLTIREYRQQGDHMEAWLARWVEDMAPITLRIGSAQFRDDPTDRWERLVQRAAGYGCTLLCVTAPIAEPRATTGLDPGEPLEDVPATQGVCQRCYAQPAMSGDVYSRCYDCQNYVWDQAGGWQNVMDMLPF